MSYTAAQLAHRRARYAANPEPERARFRAYRATHPDWAGARQRKRTSEFRSKIAAIKVERGCVDCGYNAHPDALDFDHLPDFDKLFDLAKGWSRSWDAVLQEITKCEVVCANCHRIRTAARRVR